MGGGEILKKGWLIKSPPLEGGGIKSWRKRFFYLRSSKVLEYHKSEKEDGERKGVINLEDCKAVNSNLTHKKYQFVFDIETKDRTYFLVAKSQEEMTEWVDAICKACNFSTFVLVPGEGPRNAKTFPTKSTNPQVSAPLPPAGIPLSERFKPTENGLGGDSIYSLAVAEQQSVQRQLTKEPEIPAGVPLSEALASKGMGSGGRSASVSSQSRASIDSSSVGDVAANRLSGMSDSHYFVPRSFESGAYFGPGMDTNAVYASPPSNAPLFSGSQGHFESKARSATMLPLTNDPLPPDWRHRGLTSAALYAGRTTPTSGSGAQMLENGYMKPRPTPDRVPDYDYPPLGPPRPAGPGNVSPPRQHRSALLSHSGSVSPTTPPDDRSETPPDDSHTYINVRSFQGDFPPPINRSNKPPLPQPPRIDRNLKPVRKSNAESESDSPVPLSSPSRDSPSILRQRDSISGSPPDENGSIFTDSDMPRRTSNSTTYTQVNFNPLTQRPIPLPRSGPGKPARPRVEYSDVDLEATRQLAEEKERLRIEEQKKLFERQKVTLRTAEKEHLSEKYYVNIAQDGEIDDDTNPDYYTHMRNFSFEDADKPAYYVHHMAVEDIPDSEDGELYEAPRQT